MNNIYLYTHLSFTADADAATESLLLSLSFTFGSSTSSPTARLRPTVRLNARLRHHSKMYPTPDLIQTAPALDNPLVPPAESKSNNFSSKPSGCLAYTPYKAPTTKSANA